MRISNEHQSGCKSAEKRPFQVSPEEGVRLVRAFLSITTPERRQGVLAYVLEQAAIDNPAGAIQPIVFLDVPGLNPRPCSQATCSAAACLISG